MLSLLLMTFLNVSLSFSDVNFSFDSKIKSCPLDAKEIGLEFLLIEEKGVRVNKGKTSCITQTKLKYIKAGRETGHEESGGPKFSPVVLKKGSVKIEKFKELSKELLEYQVVFSGVDSKTGNKVKDSFKFMASSLAKGNKKPRFGCGHMSMYPKKVYISEECI